MSKVKRKRKPRVKMRVLKTIRLNCGRLLHWRNDVIEVNPDKRQIKKWLREGKIEACV